MNERKSIQVTLTYHSSSATILLSPYDKINIIYERSKTLFYPVPHQVTLLYNNHPLTSFNDKDFDEVFYNRKKVNIVLVDFYQEPQRKRSQSPGRGNKSPELVKSKVPKDSELSFLHVKCRECELNSVSYYCRDCNMFICKECRLSEKSNHTTHKLIQIFYDSVNKSAFLYKQLIQSDLNVIHKDVVKSTKELKTPQLCDLLVWKKEVIEKFNLIAKLVKEKTENLRELNPDEPIDEKVIEEKYIDIQIKIEEKPTIDVNDPLKQMNDINLKDKQQTDFTTNISTMISNENTNRAINAICSKICSVFDSSLDLK